MRVSEQLAQVAVVLKDTTHPGNIGSVARAMKTMGLSRLLLVAARTQIDATSRALSAGATDILDNAEWQQTLPEALTEFTHVYAFSARRRDMSPRCLSPQEAATEAMGQVRQGGRAAFIFGGERSGLENEDILQATAIIEIAANPEFPSLNLAQAVQIAAYELRQATGIARAGDPRQMPTREELDAMIEHLQQALAAVGLPKKNDTRPLMARLRLLLTRADLDQSEVRLLRGIWRAILSRPDDEKLNSPPPAGSSEYYDGEGGQSTP
ncbi:MAG: RNA methyltransferase [Proteobacteria bacterium]|nr:RNA methyltransferase [Pseudomonadota bacterium]